MKKIIFFITMLVLCISTFSQKKIEVNSEKDIRQLTDSMVMLMKHSYTFNKEHHMLGYESAYIVRYVDSSFIEHPAMIFKFVKLIIGENRDLEIKGKPLYYLQRIDARFLDIFPIWKTYFNPHANMNEIVNNPNVMYEAKVIVNNNQISCYLKKDKDLWYIFVY